MTRLVQLPATTVACVRCGPAQDRAGAWAALTEFVLTGGLAGAGSRYIGVWYDEVGAGRYDACISVPPDRLAALPADALADHLANHPGDGAHPGVEVILGAGPYLEVDPDSREHPPGTAPPVFDTYRRNPAFSTGLPPVAQRYLTLLRPPARRPG